MQIRATWEPRLQRIGLYVTDEIGGKHLYSEPVVMTQRKERFEYREPCIVIEDKKELQSLFDDLWSMGLRPSEGTDEYKAQLGSMRDHLNDTRAIVFKSGFTKRDDLK